MIRQFAISDLHGCSVSFLALLDKLALSVNDELYLLGDYVDRGPDSKGVLDIIFQMQQNGYNVKCLCGNHEELVLRAAGGDFTRLEKWLLTDGKDTMDSFDVEQIAHIPESYLAWMATLPYYFEVGNYLLVHAGFDFTYSNPLEGLQEMKWIRRWYDAIRYDWLGERIIVHGHTPVFKDVMEDQLVHLKKNRYLDIDGGCVFSHERFVDKEGLGNLCAFDLVNQTLIFQPNVDF